MNNDVINAVLDLINSELESVKECERTDFHAKLIEAEKYLGGCEMRGLSKLLENEVRTYDERGRLTDEQVRNVARGLEWYINDYLAEQIPEQIGNELGTTLTYYVCNECHEMYDDETEYCEQCGGSVREVKEGDL